MTKAKSRRKTAYADDGKTKTRNSVRRTTTRVPRRSAVKSSTHQQPQPAPTPTVSRESKKARIIAMLRAPGGASIEAMAHAAIWQTHSVRGFLAGVVRKKLGLNLISVAGNSGRVYRITDRSATTDKTSHAA